MSLSSELWRRRILLERNSEVLRDRDLRGEAKRAGRERIVVLIEPRERRIGIEDVQRRDGDGGAGF